ncbi:MAG: BMP family ABC transporter substrate-binding protein [Armatimonadetes bacterium]|nr:BMP family ABC transporter substrate-binding protein [Armatimonadota bacterium]
MTKKFLILLILIMILSCNTSTKSAIKVGMISSFGGFENQSFTGNCQEGLERAAADFDVIAEYAEADSIGDFESVMNGLAENGCELIFPIGFAQSEATYNIAQIFPEVDFAIIDFEFEESIGNIQSIIFETDEASFPLGFLAAFWADLQDANEPKIGYVGGMDIPPVNQFIVGYLNGKNYFNEKYNKNVTDDGTYAGSFYDEELGFDLADSLISNGVDVIFPVAGQTGNGVLLAAKENEKWGIGVDVDAYFILPEVRDILLSSCLKRADNAVYNTVDDFMNDNFNGGGVYHGTLENEGVGIAPYHDFEELIPDSIKVEIETIIQDIISEELDTGWE